MTLAKSNKSFDGNIRVEDGLFLIISPIFMNRKIQLDTLLPLELQPEHSGPIRNFQRNPLF